MGPQMMQVSCGHAHPALHQLMCGAARTAGYHTLQAMQMLLKATCHGFLSYVEELQHSSFPSLTSVWYLRCCEVQAPSCQQMLRLSFRSFFSLLATT